MSLHLSSVPQHLPFLDVLAERWIAERGGTDPQAMARGLILLPTRRAARALSEAFLRASGGRVMLLPRIATLGAPDEAPWSANGRAEVPPAIEPMRRLALLSRLVLAASNRFGTAPTLDQAWPLAQALADLMDEAERAEVDLAAALPHAAGEFAQHWQVTLDFLSIVTASWPAMLREAGLSNPVARQVALLHAQARNWRETPPPHPVWAAGFTAAIPSVAALLGAVAGMDRGHVVLHGLDHGAAAVLDAGTWAALPPGHPQSGLARLLSDLDVRREDVGSWTGNGVSFVPPGRVRTLGCALLPELALARWLDRSEPADTAGLSRLNGADQQEEAAAIALVLRDALERPGRRAALVTPDRALANRVAVELGRWGIAVDDSAGEPIAATPPAMLLLLLAQAAAAGLAPVALLSLLKHPLAAGGLLPAAFRAGARALELAALRGPAPAPGAEALREAVVLACAPDPARRRTGDPAVPAFLDRVLDALAPLLSLQGAPRVAVPELLRALLASAEALAATDTRTGAAALWAGEDGNALALHLFDLAAACEGIPAQSPAVLFGLLEASMAGVAVRGRRVLRGLGEGAAEHPRLFIWGLLEARLQSVELAVLGGLAEGVWPPAVDPGPWMSRPMRARVGLPAPELAIGQAAHDFLSACCCAAEVVLSCPGRRDDAPAVPARWLARLDAFLAGQERRLVAHPAGGWLHALDQPNGPPVPVQPPRPRPPVVLRPRRLSVTEIETWMRDPYAVHARHVLRLRPLAELEQAADAADYGTIVHEALAAFLVAHPSDWPADAEAGLARAFDAALEARALRPALAAWWRPRLLRIAGWVAGEEARRRADGAPLLLRTEILGSATLDGAPGGAFTLSGRADRIERRADGRLALFDYKTGTLPSDRAVQEGWSSQLVLEAAMARLGAFGPELAAEPGEIVYWRLSGGHEPGRQRSPASAEVLDALVGRCWSALSALVAAYDDPDQPYLSHPRPGHAPPYPDYGRLARVAEWSAARDDAT